MQGDFASVTEQSGIKAGDGGFQLQVKGGTDLKGGVISSTQAAIDAHKNSLSTATLSSSDIQNRDNHKASGFSVGGSLSGNLGDQSSKQALQQMSPEDQAAAKSGAKNAGPGFTPGIGSASGSQSSSTQSGISGAAIKLTGEGASVPVALNREVTSDKDASGALKKQWDGQALMQDVQAQVQITQAALPRMAKEIGDRMGTQAAELREQARTLPDGDPSKQRLLTEAGKYDEGGAYRVCYGASSVNGSVSNAKVQSDFARVGEQSGIKAGDGGFQLQVKGGTDLKGGVIGSTQAGSGNASSTSSAGTVTDTVATCFEVGVDTVTRPYSMGERLMLAARLREGQGLCTTGAAAGWSVEPGR